MTRIFTSGSVIAREGDITRILRRKLTMKKFRSVLSALSLIGVTLFSSVANASLMGDTINASGASLSPGSATIGSGVEFTGIHGFVSFDFGDDTLVITSHNQLSGWSSFGDYVFSGFDEIINSFSLISNDGFNADFISNFGFNANSITLRMDSGSVSDWQTGATAVFSINANTVPEPESLTLMLSAFTILGAVSRRRNTVSR